MAVHEMIPSRQSVLTFVGVVGDHEAVEIIGRGASNRHPFAIQVDVGNAPLHERHAAARQQLPEGRRNLIQLRVSNCVFRTSRCIANK